MIHICFSWTTEPTIHLKNIINTTTPASVLFQFLSTVSLQREHCWIFQYYQSLGFLHISLNRIKKIFLNFVLQLDKNYQILRAIWDLFSFSIIFPIYYISNIIYFQYTHIVYCFHYVQTISISLCTNGHNFNHSITDDVSFLFYLLLRSMLPWTFLNMSPCTSVQEISEIYS